MVKLNVFRRSTEFFVVVLKLNVRTKRKLRSNMKRLIFCKMFSGAEEERSSG
jgi:hypothetical protein